MTTTTLSRLRAYVRTLRTQNLYPPTSEEELEQLHSLCLRTGMADTKGQCNYLCPNPDCKSITDFQEYIITYDNGIHIYHCEKCDLPHVWHVKYKYEWK